MASTEDPIPRKDKNNKGKGSQKENPGPKSKGNDQCFCKKCAKWAKPLMHTHSMAQCHAWDAKGNDLFKPNGESKNLFDELKRNYSTMQKDTKKLQKKFKREEKRSCNKEKHCKTSSSESSDSE